MRLWGGVLVFATWAAQAQVYKCPDASGRLALQQAPCEGGTQLVQKPKPAMPATETGTPPGAEAPVIDSTAINRAIVGSYPVRGMTLKELQQAMGAPTRVNAGDYASAYREQRIYERPGGTYYVYTENGFVAAIQFTQAIRPAAPVQQARACPGELDIRNAEVSANSIALNEEQRREKMEVVKRMRECR